MNPSLDLDASQVQTRSLPLPVLRFLAWGVHLYTALGLVLAASIAVLLVRGGPDAFRWSFILMLIATLVDATDGTLARKVRVKKVLPNFDGRKLDDLTDFLTYTFLPLLLIWRAQLLPAGCEPWLLFPLLASAYGFCQVEAKTDDGYFLGFPSLWNIVAFYLYVLDLNPWVALGIVIVLSLMTFVPSRYLYPSQPGLLNRVSNILGAIWTVFLVVILLGMPVGHVPSPQNSMAIVAWISLFYPIYYMGASWTVTLKRWLQPES
ncbi:CDP-alcohol phosphatidyltransferase family protein [Singulisphaera sp. PoT]|uniref:CDP-alcohol phosphatidyltransferase family protein n=1 Tax=Singulisphaera sp. PoT TaxID=3411797 RepID=UPI003BF4D52F